MPGALSDQATFLDEHPDYGLVVGDALLFNEFGELGLKSLRTGRPQNPENFRWETVEYCATPSTAMARKDVLEQVGLFYETVKRSSEDWLMWVKLSLHTNLGYLDRPLVRYRLHGSNLTRDIETINSLNRHAVDQVARSAEFSRYPASFGRSYCTIGLLPPGESSQSKWPFAICFVRSSPTHIRPGTGSGSFARE